MDTYLTKEYWEHRCDDSRAVLNSWLSSAKGRIANLGADDEIMAVLLDVVRQVEPMVTEYNKCKAIVDAIETAENETTIIID